MTSFSRKKPPTLPPEAKHFIDDAGTAPEQGEHGTSGLNRLSEAPPAVPLARIQVAFRLPAESRQRLARLATRISYERERRVTEQALFEEAIALLFERYDSKGSQNPS